MRAHNWVVLGALLDNPGQPPWCLPLSTVAVHQCSYAYCTLHREPHGDFTWLFAGLMGAAAWRPARRASTTISGSLLEQIIVPGCAASQRTGKVWRYQRGFSMSEHRTPDVPAVKRLVPRLRGDVRRPFRVTVFDRRQLADEQSGCHCRTFPAEPVQPCSPRNDFEESRK